MDKLIGFVVDVIRKLLRMEVVVDSPLLLNDELHFLRERKELSPIRVWLLDIFEKNPSERFDTSLIFEMWMPLVLSRTNSTPTDINQDGCFTRLQDLEDRRFISMVKTSHGKMWAMSDDYKLFFVPRNEDSTIFTSKDEGSLTK